MKRKKLLVLASLLAAVAASALLLRPSLEVEVINVTSGLVTDTFTEEGTAKKGEDINIVSTVSGNVIKLFATKNSYIEKGSKIAEIDTKDYERQKIIRKNNIKAYEAQISDILNTEKNDKKDIAYSIKELNVLLDSYKKNKELSEINKVISDSPEEYIERLKLEKDGAESDYEYLKFIYETQKSLYASETVSESELIKAENSYIKAKNALAALQLKYDQSVEKLSELKALGIDDSNLNSRFFEGQSNDLDSTIQATEIKLAALQEKLKNDYSSDVVLRLKALIDAEETAISDIDELIENCSITAPYSGYITSCPIENISFISEGQTIATVKSEKLFTVYADVLTNSVPYLKTGDYVKLTQKLKGEDNIYNGKIKEIYGYAEESFSALGLKEQRVRIIIDVIDGNTSLQDGYEVDVEFEIYRGENKLFVPNSCLFKKDGQSYVFKKEHGRAASVPVETGYKTSTKTVIESGLSEDDTVIYNSNTEGLSEGTKISFLNP